MLPKPLYSAAMKNGRFPTVEGQFVDISSNEGEGVKVNDARVTDPDVTANNGIVHTIDKVLMPVSGILQFNTNVIDAPLRELFSNNKSASGQSFRSLVQICPVPSSSKAD